MPDKKQINSVDALLVEGGSGSFETSFNENICDAEVALIADKNGVLNYIPYVQGELVVLEKDQMKTRFYVDSNGCLIVVGENANKYSINSLGELIYTY